MEKIFPKNSKIKIRRRTLTRVQRILLHLSWIAAIVVTPLLFVLFTFPEGSLTFYLAVFGPVGLAFITMLNLALFPKGPEKDFVIDAFQGITPQTPFSCVSGQIRLADGGQKGVEVIIPTVFSPESSLLDTSVPSTSCSVASEETAEWALEALHEVYPDAVWLKEPEITDAAKEDSRTARKKLTQHVEE